MKWPWISRRRHEAELRRLRREAEFAAMEKERLLFSQLKKEIEALIEVRLSQQPGALYIQPSIMVSRHVVEQPISKRELWSVIVKQVGDPFATGRDQ